MPRPRPSSRKPRRSSGPSRSCARRATDFLLVQKRQPGGCLFCLYFPPMTRRGVCYGSMNAALNIVILAAGKGPRMYFDRPTVLHRLAGRPLLQHVLETARQLEPARICVVYGYGGSAVPDTFRGASVLWVEQNAQLGTGHALQQALPHLDREGVTLVLYGDVPLTGVQTLRQLVEVAQQGRLALLTAEFADPDGYGRIVRNARGEVVRIVEQKDATAEERALRSEEHTSELQSPKD